MRAAADTSARAPRWQWRRRRPVGAKVAAPPGLERELVTPEGVDLRVTLASASERAGAFLVDAAAIVGVMIVASLLCFLLAKVSPRGAQSAAAALWLLGFFVLRNGWFLGFELGPRAATPGKRVFGLRVAARHGGRLSADALFARNAMREVEVFLPLTFLVARAQGIDAVMAGFGLLWAAVFTFLPLFNRDRLRAGDIVAGTWVVRDPRRSLTAELTDAPRRDDRFRFEPRHLSAYGVAELQVLEAVLRGHDRRAVRVVADRIRAKIGWVRGPEETDAAFLDAYYTALRGRLEAAACSWAGGGGTSTTPGERPSSEHLAQATRVEAAAYAAKLAVDHAHPDRAHRAQHAAQQEVDHQRSPEPRADRRLRHEDVASDAEDQSDNDADSDGG